MIELRQVSFWYHGRDVATLADIDLSKLKFPGQK